jgi:hypothetical protein
MFAAGELLRDGLKNIGGQWPATLEIERAAK